MNLNQLRKDMEEIANPLAFYKKRIENNQPLWNNLNELEEVHDLGIFSKELQIYKSYSLRGFDDFIDYNDDLDELKILDARYYNNVINELTYLIDNPFPEENTNQ